VLVFISIGLRIYTIYLIIKENYSFILDLKPLREEYYSFLRGFFNLYKYKKLSGLYESMCRGNAMYIPDILCV
jgi:hypothetical protein